ncbi:MAG: helix-turn-helix transcriptional regulator [Veillonellales bacterium]
MKNQRLIDKRSELGLTQIKLSEIVGISQSMLARIESGCREPSKETKIEIACYFGVTVEWLFYEDFYDSKSCKQSNPKPAA